MWERTGAYRVLVGRSEGKDHLKEPSLNGRVILKWICRKWHGGMDRIDLAQDRDRWWALLNAVMNLRVP